MNALSPNTPLYLSPVVISEGSCVATTSSLRGIVCLISPELGDRRLWLKRRPSASGGALGIHPQHMFAFSRQLGLIVHPDGHVIVPLWSRNHGH